MMKFHTNTVMAIAALMLLSSAAAMAASKVDSKDLTQVINTYKGQELSKEAIVSIEDAKVAALKARPGKVTDAELEKEDGGLRYSFDIKSGDAEYEVGVDAKTGKLLENSEEGNNPD